MISDMMINLVYEAFMFAMGGYQPLHFNFELTLVDTVEDFLSFIFFILPVKNMLNVLPIIIAVIGFRILIAFVTTIWRLLPFT